MVKPRGVVTPGDTRKPRQSSGLQGLGELPQLATLEAYCHILLLGEETVVHDSTRR